MSENSEIGTDRLKHLEFVQAVVARLANNSLLIRGWALTLLAGFLAVLATKFEPGFAAAALVPLAAFWLLDSYFLWRERIYRRFYEDVRQPSSSIPPLSMDVGTYAAAEMWWRSAISNTVLLFYGPLAMLLIALLVAATIAG